jgi:hypothetical protein
MGDSECWAVTTSFEDVAFPTADEMWSSKPVIMRGTTCITPCDSKLQKNKKKLCSLSP